MTDFREKCANVDAALAKVEQATKRTRKVLRDRRYEPPGPEVKEARPEYLLHLKKTQGPDDLVYVDEEIG